MGMTIHYSLQADTRSPHKARQFVQELRRKALTCPSRRSVRLSICVGQKPTTRMWTKIILKTGC